MAPLSLTDERHDAASFPSSTVGEVVAGGGEQWLAMGGDAECSFVPANAPYILIGPGSVSDDPISWVQTWKAGDEVMDISARTFSSTGEATAFMHDLHARVGLCPWQDLEQGPAGGMDSQLVQLTAQAAIDVPAEIAAVGWVREGSPGARWRSYVWDLQRGNLIVQVRVLTDGRVLESQVAEFAELIASRLEVLEPSQR